MKKNLNLKKLFLNTLVCCATTLFVLCMGGESWGVGIASNLLSSLKKSNPNLKILSGGNNQSLFQGVSLNTERPMGASPSSGSDTSSSCNFSDFYDSNGIPNADFCVSFLSTKTDGDGYAIPPTCGEVRASSGKKLASSLGYDGYDDDLEIFRKGCYHIYCLGCSSPDASVCEKDNDKKTDAAVEDIIMYNAYDQVFEKKDGDFYNSELTPLGNVCELLVYSNKNRPFTCGELNTDANKTSYQKKGLSYLLDLLDYDPDDSYTDSIDSWPLFQEFLAACYKTYCSDKDEDAVVYNSADDSYKEYTEKSVLTDMGQRSCESEDFSGVTCKQLSNDDYFYNAVNSQTSSALQRKDSWPNFVNFLKACYNQKCKGSTSSSVYVYNSADEVYADYLEEKNWGACTTDSNVSVMSCADLKKGNFSTEIENNYPNLMKFALACYDEVCCLDDDCSSTKTTVGESVYWMDVANELNDDETSCCDIDELASMTCSEIKEISKKTSSSPEKSAMYTVYKKCHTAQCTGDIKSTAGYMNCIAQNPKQLCSVYSNISSEDADDDRVDQLTSEDVIKNAKNCAAFKTVDGLSATQLRSFQTCTDIAKWCEVNQ